MKKSIFPHHIFLFFLFLSLRTEDKIDNFSELPAWYTSYQNIERLTNGNSIFCSNTEKYNLPFRSFLAFCNDIGYSKLNTMEILSDKITFKGVLIGSSNYASPRVKLNARYNIPSNNNWRTAASPLFKWTNKANPTSDEWEYTISSRNTQFQIEVEQSNSKNYFVLTSITLSYNNEEYDSYSLYSSSNLQVLSNAIYGIKKYQFSSSDNTCSHKCLSPKNNDNFLGVCESSTLALADMPPIGVYELVFDSCGAPRDLESLISLFYRTKGGDHYTAVASSSFIQRMSLDGNREWTVFRLYYDFSKQTKDLIEFSLQILISSGFALAIDAITVYKKISYSVPSNCLASKSTDYIPSGKQVNLVPECNAGKNCVSGLNFIIAGFNLLTGRYSFNKIFQFSFSGNIDKITPDEIEYVVNTDISQQTKFNSYESTIDLEEDFGGGITAPIFKAFTGSLDYKETYRQITEQKKTVTKTIYSKNIHILSLKSYNLNSLFVSTVKNSDSSFNQVINIYGTHYVQQVTIGGTITMTSSAETCAVFKQKSKEISAEGFKKIMGSVKNGIGAGINYESIGVERDYYSSFTNTFEVKGGIPEYYCQNKGWESSIQNNPSFTFLQLNKISDLISWDDDLKDNLSDAIDKYMKTGYTFDPFDLECFKEIILYRYFLINIIIGFMLF